MFTQSMPLEIKKSCDHALRLIHTSNVGGVSVTLHTAETVIPYLLFSWAVVTTETALPSIDMPLRKSLVSIIFVTNSFEVEFIRQVQ